MSLMASSSAPTLQQLRHLDKSSLDFPAQLNDILNGEDYRTCVSTLQGDDLTSLVNLLDEALGCLTPLSAAFEKCRSELGEICSSRAVLPKSCAISPCDVQVSPEPSASGGYGDVYLGSFDASRACVKRIRVPDPKYMSAAEKAFCEVALLWRDLKHPNIVPILGFTVTRLQIVSQWMPSGNLPDYIRRNRSADIVRLLFEVARGIQYLHSRSVIHRAIKGSNILVDPAGHARISDPGLSMITSRENNTMGSYQPEHSQRWTAPEALVGGTFTTAADIFSFALLMVEVFTGVVPFGDLSGFNAAVAMLQGERPQKPTHSAMSGRLWTLMQRCWDRVPHLRPEAVEVSGLLEIACRR